MTHGVSRFAPTEPRTVFPVRGVALASGCCHLKSGDVPDLMIAEVTPHTVIAGLLTRSSTCAPAVDWCRAILERGEARGLVVHAGNANAFTGRRGLKDVEDLASAVAQCIGCTQQEVLVASTGIIGVPIPREQVFSAVPPIAGTLGSGTYEECSNAIMTTDTFAKWSSAKFTSEGRDHAVTGIAKGSGMIMPDMGTMLCFIFTDFAVSSAVLSRLLHEINEDTFRCVTVDGDTSTNDTLIVFSTPHDSSSRTVTDYDDRTLGEFRTALHHVMDELSMDLVRDGEGVSKMIRIGVNGAADQESARLIGMSIANSPLVKTAIAGGHPNWGRIVMAIGKSGQPVNRDRISIRLGSFLLGHEGDMVEPEDPRALQAYMDGDTIEVEVDVGVGTSSRVVWTTDLTESYININARYAT